MQWCGPRVALFTDCSLYVSVNYAVRCCVDVTPSAVHVGNIVQGVRMAWAQGRDLGAVDDDSDAAKKVGTVHLLRII